MAIFNSKQFVYQAGYLLKFDLFFLIIQSGAMAHGCG